MFTQRPISKCKAIKFRIKMKSCVSATAMAIRKIILTTCCSCQKILKSTDLFDSLAPNALFFEMYWHFNVPNKES